MRAPLLLAVVLVLVAGAFAGCTGDKDSKGGGAELNDLGAAAPGAEGFGAVEGVVMDDAFNPLANVTVRLLPGTAEQVTRDGGSFRFEGVAAGRYRVAFTAETFLEAARVAEVRDGEATRVEVQLAPAPSTDPYVDSIPFAGFLECGVAVPGVAAYGNGQPTSANCLAAEPPPGLKPPTNDRHTFLFEARSNLSSMVVEVAWDEGLNAAATRFVVLLEQAGSGGDGGLVHKRAAGPSPLRLEMAPDEILTAGLTAGGALQVRVFVDADLAPGAAVQQSFQVVASQFYFAPHDDGFTALP